MKPLPTEGYTGLYFTTATIKGWKHLLKPDKYKQIVSDAMTFLAEREEVWFYAFVIMPNHIHWIWQLQGDTILSSVQQRMLKYVAGQIRVDLEIHHPLTVVGVRANNNAGSTHTPIPLLLLAGTPTTAKAYEQLPGVSIL